MTAAAIPPAIAPRVGALLRLLGSDIDGEALGAARALRRTLGGVGLDLHALADAVERATEPATPPRGRAAREPRRRRETRSRNTGCVELDPTKRRQVVDVLSTASARGALSSWEEEFVTSILATLRGARPLLSARQHEIVERLLSKHGEDRAWA